VALNKPIRSPVIAVQI